MNPPFDPAQNFFAPEPVQPEAGYQQEPLSPTNYVDMSQFAMGDQFGGIVDQPEQVVEPQPYQSAEPIQFDNVFDQYQQQTAMQYPMQTEPQQEYFQNGGQAMGTFDPYAQAPQGADTFMGAFDQFTETPQQVEPGIPQDSIASQLDIPAKSATKRSAMKSRWL